MTILSRFAPDTHSNQGAASGELIEHPTRNLRSFDIEAVAPYDHKGLVAFLKAEKLTELTSSQIRVFLMLYDHKQPEGHSAVFIAHWLDIAPSTVRSCLRALKDKGYVMNSKRADRDGGKPAGVAWVCDPANLWADENHLFWEFAKLP